MLHAGLKTQLKARLPFGVIAPLFLILFLSVLNLLSAAQNTRPDLYLAHILNISVGVIFLFITAIIPPRFIKFLSFISLIAIIILLLWVIKFGISVNGAQRWISIFGYRLQPSDPAKICLVLGLAKYCSIYWPNKGYSIYSLLKPFNVSRPILSLFLYVAFLIKYSEKYLPVHFLKSKLGAALLFFIFAILMAWLFFSLANFRKNGLDLKNLISPIDIIFVIFFLIAIEPDLGTSIIALSISFGMIFYIGIKRTSFFLAILIMVFTSIFSYYFVLKDYQKDRIESFLNPKADSLGKNYQSIQSIIAIGSGGFLGKGFKEGTQTQLSFLPENSTDFAFSVFAEEWGFFFCLILLGLYVWLILSILSLVQKTQDRFSELLCIGVAWYIFIHIIVNIGMVTGLLPVVGAPLVLMSYGGSSVVTTLIGIGLVVNVALWRGSN